MSNGMSTCTNMRARTYLASEARLRHRAQAARASAASLRTLQQVAARLPSFGANDHAIGKVQRSQICEARGRRLSDGFTALVRRGTYASHAANTCWAVCAAGRTGKEGMERASATSNNLLLWSSSRHSDIMYSRLLTGLWYMVELEVKAATPESRVRRGTGDKRFFFLFE